MSTGQTWFMLWLLAGAAGGIPLVYLRTDRGGGTEEAYAFVGLAFGPFTLLYTVVRLLTNGWKRM